MEYNLPDGIKARVNICLELIIYGTFQIKLEKNYDYDNKYS